MEGLHFAALAGFVVAVLGSFLAWLRVSGNNRSETVNAWSSDAQFRFADWFSIDAPLDALLILVLAGAGAYLLFGRVLGSNVSSVPFGVAAAGFGIALIGILNWIFIDSESSRVVNPDLDVGFGVYLVVLGGAAAAVSGFIDAQRDRAALTQEPQGR